MLPAVSDTDKGVVVVTTPANPFVLAGLQPGESRSYNQSVSVNYLDDPTEKDWGGGLRATYTDVVYTAWSCFARGPGLVAMVNLEDVTAFWILSIDTTVGKVLAAK